MERTVKQISIIDGEDYEFFWKFCRDGNLEEIKQFLSMMEPNFDISAENGYAFRLACKNGHLKVAKWLFFMTGNKSFAMQAFCYACLNKHLKVAKWLFLINPKIKFYLFFDFEFYHIYNSNHVIIAKYISQLIPKHYYLFIEKRKILECKVYCKKRQIAKLI